MKISGQRILVTGAGGGIGSELALALAEKGAELALVNRDSLKLEKLKASVHSAGGKAHLIPVDLGANGAIQRLTYRATEMMGGVDVLINCAGISNFGMFEEVALEEIETMWRVNAIAPMQLARALLPQMIARKHGRIVNIGSIFGSIGFAYFTAYSASKFAMRGFSEALRRELEGSGVGVTYVAPRYTKTPFNNGTVSRMANAVGMNIDEPGEVARHVVRAIENDSKDYYIGWPESLFVRINSILPRLVDKALRKQNLKTRTFAIAE